MSDGLCPKLSVVICSLGLALVERAATSVAHSIEKGAVSREIIIVWQNTAEPPNLPLGARVVQALPSGISYARNRGLAQARVLIFGSRVASLVRRDGR